MRFWTGDGILSHIYCQLLNQVESSVTKNKIWGCSVASYLAVILPLKPELELTLKFFKEKNQMLEPTIINAFTSKDTHQSIFNKLV